MPRGNARVKCRQPAENAALAAPCPIAAGLARAIRAAGGVFAAPQDR